VKAFFDTSALIPVFLGDHPHHEASLSTFLRFNRDNACCGAHSLAELYSAVTRMPAKHRVTGDQAMLFVGDVLERLDTIALTASEYVVALDKWSKAGVLGGTIYDALLASCALKVDAEVIYSWNLRHYRGLGDEVARRVQQPGPS
jgi:predicted nucleic acid-binding protein